MYRTTPRRSTGETPFSMTYEVEVGVPIEVNLLSIRVDSYNQEGNDVRMIRILDTLKERRDAKAVRLAYYQKRLAKGYNRALKSKKFVLGNLGLRKAVGNMKDWSTRKLALNWEGP